MDWKKIQKEAAEFSYIGIFHSICNCEGVSDNAIRRKFEHRIKSMETWLQEPSLCAKPDNYFPYWLLQNIGSKDKIACLKSLKDEKDYEQEESLFFTIFAV